MSPSNVRAPTPRMAVPTHASPFENRKNRICTSTTGRQAIREQERENERNENRPQQEEHHAQNGERDDDERRRLDLGVAQLVAVHVFCVPQRASSGQVSRRLRASVPPCLRVRSSPEASHTETQRHGDTESDPSREVEQQDFAFRVADDLDLAAAAHGDCVAGGKKFAVHDAPYRSRRVSTRVVPARARGSHAHCRPAPKRTPARPRGSWPIRLRRRATRSAEAGRACPRQ